VSGPIFGTIPGFLLSKIRFSLKSVTLLPMEQERVPKYYIIICYLLMEFLSFDVMALTKSSLMDD
jgi:hypothetical protein